MSIEPPVDWQIDCATPYDFCPKEAPVLGDSGYLLAPQLRSLADRLEEAASAADTHAAGVSALKHFFGEHFPVLCEVIGEVIRDSGHRRFAYWCDVAEMSAFTNYHFTVDDAVPLTLFNEGEAAGAQDSAGR